MARRLVSIKFCLRKQWICFYIISSEVLLECFDGDKTNQKYRKIPGPHLITKKTVKYIVTCMSQVQPLISGQGSLHILQPWQP